MKLLNFLWLCGLISMVVLMVYLSFVKFAKANKKERTKYDTCIAPGISDEEYKEINLP